MKIVIKFLIIINIHINQTNMYQVPKFTQGSIRRNVCVAGETIEMKIERLVNNKEPIAGGKDSAPLIFTERKEGVKKAYNIRTDRFEIAIEAMDKVSKSYQARREEKMKNGKKEDGGAESTQGKEQSSTTSEPKV